jgi:predicted metal-binding membrane protein
MPMPGDLMMSMPWMPMPGQTWPGVAASFLSMWVVMMVAMMLPSLMPILWRYRRAAERTHETRSPHLVTPFVGGYFLVWSVFGMAVFPLGAALTLVRMQFPVVARFSPIGVGVVILIAGVLQFTTWKARHLAYCSDAPRPGRSLPVGTRGAWSHGIQFGMHCSQCCVGLMAILLVIGVMDVRAMLVVAAAITVERLAPAGQQVARITGTIVVGTGLILIARATGLG